MDDKWYIFEEEEDDKRGEKKEDDKEGEEEKDDKEAGRREW